MCISICHGGVSSNDIPGLNIDGDAVDQEVANRRRGFMPDDQTIRSASVHRHAGILYSALPDAFRPGIWIPTLIEGGEVEEIRRDPWPTSEAAALQMARDTIDLRAKVARMECEAQRASQQETPREDHPLARNDVRSSGARPAGQSGKTRRGLGRPSSPAGRPRRAVASALRK